ncbi:3-phosphoshikimate 1-carboxyvinyltransferase [Ruminococcus sp. Marseille-P6503]|uniref:3-phosphoshikimate 1-carboxyvinyltransferase n=1 Tax=Ruminococcus sp. Marseille-P6503 TaxID=2364796 RepID=UPI000F53D221|nr:3-phosphoshikimate 1-carboxyvinyltransferase [Ruminococcus sp. Marseille-P6503]
MDIKITPSKLAGTVKIPPSKSVAHRMIIAAALAEGRSEISNLYPSEDILATMECMRRLGARIEFSGARAVVTGIEKIPEKAALDCGESGSTLRFLMPVAAALGVECTFLGRGKLPVRPITPYIEEFPGHGVTIDFSGAGEGEFLPCTIRGKLTSGDFSLSGGISSQFITGLLFALPVLDGDSRISLTSRLESRPYVDITSGTLKDFGCEITDTADGFSVRGGQVFTPFNGAVEGDYSQAAFFEVANALGSSVKIDGLNVNSYQGDKKIIEICREMVYNKNGTLLPFELDCSDIPDLVPILAVLGTFCMGRSHIANAARLRIKECDRLAAMAHNLNAVGAEITELPDGLELAGVGSLRGGVVDSCNDHRIAMAMAVASTRCTEPLIITGAECVSKSYPNFWEDFRALGGNFEVI